MSRGQLYRQSRFAALRTQIYAIIQQVAPAMTAVFVYFLQLAVFYSSHADMLIGYLYITEYRTLR